MTTELDIELIALLPAYKENMAKEMVALVDYLETRGITFHDAVPILALTCGTMLKVVARTAPDDQREAHLEEGLSIAIDMITTGAKAPTT
jgi:hypothetical protein